MISLQPILYKYLSTTTSSLVTLPLDIIQKKTISITPVEFNFSEFKWVLLWTLILTSQNIVYNELSYIQNIAFRGALSGILITPLYIYFEINKMYDLLKIFPDYLTYINIILFRQTVFFSLLYKISSLNILYSTFISAFIANTFDFPIKLYALYKSYSIFQINKDKLNILIFLQIIKTSISDGLSLYLINNQ